MFFCVALPSTCGELDREHKLLVALQGGTTLQPCGELDREHKLFVALQGGTTLQGQGGVQTI